jgi:predicted DNA-binding transcriptional regulator AlpA
MEYEFTLKYQLDATDGNPDDLIERLGAAGCDDALIGIGQPGQLGFKFTRAAASAKEAVTSALADIRAAVPTARLVEAGPDFVGLTDVAELMGMSRQNLRKLMVANPSSFPVQVHDSSAGVWHLADLLAWLQQKDYPVDTRVVAVSQTTRQINVLKELHNLPTGIEPALRALVV